MRVRYPLAARLLHWIMALLILAMLALGLAMVDSLASWRTTALGVHKICGLLVLLLALVRIALKAFYRAPPLGDAVPMLQQRIAGLTHGLLYALILAVPLAGLLMQGAAGTPIALVGNHVLAVPIAEGIARYGALRTAHAILAWSLLGLVLAHISAALHHGFVRKDGLLRRML